jgi:hypothetical protein
VSPGGKSPDFEQLHTSGRPGNLLRVGPTAYQYVRRRSGFRLHDRARFLCGGDRFFPRPAQETGEGEPLAFEAPDPTEMWLGRPLA